MLEAKRRNQRTPNSTRQRRGSGTPPVHHECGSVPVFPTRTALRVLRPVLPITDIMSCRWVTTYLAHLGSMVIWFGAAGGLGPPVHRPDSADESGKAFDSGVAT